MIKICTKCGEYKSVGDFYKKKDGSPFPMCKSCYKKASKKYYHANSSVMLEKAVEYRIRNLEFFKNKDKINYNGIRQNTEQYVWYRAYKKENPCLHCDETDTDELQFHHRVPTEKIDTVSHMVSSNQSMEMILTEVAKCDILCKKCHAKVHKKYGKDMLKEETVK